MKNMKKLAILLITLFTFINVNSQDLFKLVPTGYINDYENIFTPEQKNNLDSIISNYEKKTSIEFCVITTNEFDFTRSVDLYNSENWGIGKRELNNGLLFIISKNQRDYSVTTGYGLEEFLPDGKLSQFASDIFPRTLSVGDFYGGVKEFILACQNELGDEGYDMLIKNKKIQEQKLKESRKEFFNDFLYVCAILLFLSGIGYVIYVRYKKHKKYLQLKTKNATLLKSIDTLKDKIENKTKYDFPIELKHIYNRRVTPSDSYRIKDVGSYFKITNKKFVTEDTLQKNQIVYNKLSDFNKTINTIDNSVANILMSKIEIEKYMKNNYPYCDKYLKNELDNMLLSINNQKVYLGNNYPYSKEKMNMLTSSKNLLEQKLSSFLNKTVKINNIVVDHKNINNTIKNLKESHIKYVNNRSILSSIKIGNRFNSLVNIDFDNYISKISSNISESFNSLENNKLDNALLQYGNYVTTISVLSNAFSSVETLLNSYNRSDNYIKLNKNNISTLTTKIDSKINKSGVSYTRKSTYQNIKNDISKYEKNLNIDIILSASLLKTILDDLKSLYSKIKYDIAEKKRKDDESSYSYSSSYSSSSSSSSSSFGGFGGGRSGGGGISGGF